MQRCAVNLKVENQFHFLGTYCFYVTDNSILNLKTHVKSRLKKVVLECLLYYTIVLH